MPSILDFDRSTQPFDGVRSIAAGFMRSVERAADDTTACSASYLTQGILEGNARAEYTAGIRLLGMGSLGRSTSKPLAKERVFFSGLDHAHKGLYKLPRWLSMYFFQCINSFDTTP